ncbi:MAG: radical SAM/SPASM domain protein, ACGX system [Actinobacteria bacterium]|nr:radical SAM/SPASM domain protein, ACGX system [Actinomycetota bacterium]
MKPSFAFQWHITDECDQRCEHCYIFSNDTQIDLRRMSFEQMEQVFESCLAMRDSLGREPYFYLTGGDPILHPDFWRLVELISSKGLSFAVMGNPFHLTEEVCDRLKAHGCRKYQLSLDGLEKTHDLFRKPGSFAATLAAIPLIRDAGIYCAVMTTVSNVNIAEIPDLIDLVAELEVDVFAFGRYCPTSGQKSEEYHVEPDVYREFLLRCQEKFDAHKESSTTFQLKDHLWTLLQYEQGRFTIPADADPEMVYDGCHCGVDHMTILPNGDVYACRRMESKVGNVFSTPMEELFLSDEMDCYRCIERFEKCTKCELKNYCRGCPAVAYGYTGNMYVADPQCWKEVS